MSEAKKWYEATWIKTVAGILTMVIGIGLGTLLKGSETFDLSNGGQVKIEYDVNKSVIKQWEDCKFKAVGDKCIVKAEFITTMTKAPTKVVETPVETPDTAPVETPDIDVVKTIKSIELKPEVVKETPDVDVVKKEVKKLELVKPKVPIIKKVELKK